MSVTIRKAEASDFVGISETHVQCFPDSFSTSLGKNSDLLEEYYREFYSISPELFIVAQNDNGEIVGFCMGYYVNNKGIAPDNFKKKNAAKIYLNTILLIIKLDRAAWKKATSFIFYKPVSKDYHLFEDATDKTIGDLLSICVKEKYRGDGTAKQLMSKFETQLITNGRRYCQLSVKNDNGRGIRFYEKNGYIPYKSIKQDETIYIKELS